MTLPADKLVTIIRAFSHEMSSVVESYDGFMKVRGRRSHSILSFRFLTNILPVIRQFVVQNQ